MAGWAIAMANMNFFRKWLMRRLADAEEIAAQETPYKPTQRLELPPLNRTGDHTGEEPRYGLWSALVFLSLLSSPAWGAAVGYFIFSNFYDGARAKALGVAAGITFTPAIVFFAILLFGGYIILSRKE